MSLRELLVNYSQRAATRAEVLRSLVSFQGWIVPVVQFHEELFTNKDPPTAELEHDVILYSKEVRLPQDQLWLFTDHEAACRARDQGVLLGMCEAGVAGTEIFSNLNPEWERVTVNPGSPAEEGCMFVSRDGYSLLKEMAAGLLLEDALESSTSESEVIEHVRRFRSFKILIWNDDQTYFTHVNNPLGLTRSPIACTTPDCVDPIVKRLPPDQMKRGVRVVDIDGASLLDVLPKEGCDGVSFNPAGPGFSFTLKL
jgi:hypothetical protein